MLMLIYHLTTRADWEQAQPAGYYQAASLASDGFIHASTPAQIETVANAFYREVAECVLLAIDPARLTAPLQWEAPLHPNGASAEPTAERFPHIYGVVALAAVVAVIPFPLGADGKYHFPVKSAPI
jgi:uncharacterized protein (DUF952 family)